MQETRSKTAEVLESFEHLPDSAFVRERVVRSLFGNVSHSTVWRFVKQGIIPAPRKLSVGVSVWCVADLRAALAAVKAAA
jgi:predicted DNA-binding transcriptional regulator AlpA